MLNFLLGVLLAPAVAAYVFPWAPPEPTLVLPEADNWSPRITASPQPGGLELFRRDDGDNTCGYLSGLQTSSLTCNNVGFVCATNAQFGVHGCCDPSSLSACSLPTTCIAASGLAASCDSACSSNKHITKCTNIARPFCYQWHYDYGTTVMTEFGCATQAFTVSVPRTYEGEDPSSVAPTQAAVPIATVTVTASTSGASGSLSSTGSSSSDQNNAAPATGAPAPSNKKAGSKSHTGAIVGGVVGGLAAVGALGIAAVFLMLRSRKKRQQAGAAAAAAALPPAGPAPGVAEYKPAPPQSPASQPVYFAEDAKPGAYQQPHLGSAGTDVGGVLAPQPHAYGTPISPAPQYSPGSAGTPAVAGIAEAGGSPVQSPQMSQMAPQQQLHHPVHEAAA